METMIGLLLVHGAKQSLKLEVKLLDWVACIWPPKNIKDTGSYLHTKLKEAIIQSGLEKNIFGNYLVSLPPVEPRATPPAFASDPLVHISAADDGEKINANSFDSIKDKSLTSSGGIASLKISEEDIVEIEGPSSVGNHFMSDQDPNFMKSKNATTPGATTRKGSYHVERQNSENSLLDCKLAECGSHLWLNYAISSKDLYYEIASVNKRMEGKFVVVEDKLKKLFEAKPNSTTSEAKETTCGHGRDGNPSTFRGRENPEVEILEGEDEMPPLEPLSREEMSIGYKRSGVDFVRRGEDFDHQGVDFERRRGEWV
ncbi:hypothetical protein M5K25_013290 [Dendrobium thyrsiflorum]|uniref:ZFPL1-like U-box domain-containing protein n=1 Tax=Dendrobium thyrsiflorum TaxID=117978 RepID=A0ABD0UZG2_DENTH